MTEPGHQLIRILIVDDHHLVREGLKCLLATTTDCVVIGEAENGQQALKSFIREQPDVILMDARMPVIDGIQATRAIQQLDPQACIVILSAYDDEDLIYQAIQQGATSYLTKMTPAEEMIQLIRAAYHGEQRLLPQVVSKLVERIGKPALTTREKAVLRLVAEGKSNQEIGQILGLVEGTVKLYMTRIMKKLNAQDRANAVKIALQRGIL